MSKLPRALACAAALAALGACAPQFHLARGPGACSPMQRHATHRASVLGTMQKVQRIQARASLTARYASANVESWRSAASGECD